MAERERALDPEVLSRIRNLELQARAVVEGYLAGSHRSSRHGFAVEFAQHREYAPGDEVKHVDWKVYGRTERYYLKQYEMETNLIGWLLLDASDSMRFGSTERTKFEVACTAALSLAYLLVMQGDSAGLATFDSQVRHFLRPTSKSTQLHDIAGMLVDGPSTETTRLGPVLHELADRTTRHGMVMLFSDLLDEPEDILAGLRHLNYAHHDVVVFHVLDAAELEFPYGGPTLFRGLEQLPDLLTDPRGVRESYLEELHKFLARIKKGCRDLQIDYVPLRTDEDLGLALAGYLSRRAGK